MGRGSAGATNEVREPFGEILSVHVAWDVGEEAHGASKGPHQTALVSFGTPMKTLKSTPPQEKNFLRDATVRLLTFLGAARCGAGTAQGGFSL